MIIAPMKKEVTVFNPKNKKQTPPTVKVADIVALFRALDEKRRKIHDYKLQFDDYVKECGRDMTVELAELTYNEAVDDFEKSRDEFYALVDLFGEQNPEFGEVMRLIELDLYGESGNTSNTFIMKRMAERISDNEKIIR
ncbi:MAG: hypothetical protein FWC00_05685 [Firmicutes bacterium]|nr:hypothetical protein [Bacillota bacterium]